MSRKEIRALLFAEERPYKATFTHTFTEILRSLAGSSDVTVMSDPANAPAAPASGDDGNEEILEAFAQEINDLKSDLFLIFLGLYDDYKQPRLFECFGQLVDRIYGTAATLGFKEVAEYTKVMKTICYKCSQTDNLYAMGKVKDLIYVYVENIDRLAATIHDPKLMSKLRSVFSTEIDKANSLAKSIFGTINRGSIE